MGNSMQSRERDIKVYNVDGRLTKTDKDILKQHFDRVQEGMVSGEFCLYISKDLQNL